MNKMFAVLKREYLQAVRRKAFIIMTLLFPFLMLAMMAIPMMVASRGMGEKKIAILDGTGRLREAFLRPNEKPKIDGKQEVRDAVAGRRRGIQMPTNLRIEYVAQPQQDVAQVAKQHLGRLASEG
ncbi:MAG TPA: hypothetical protein VF111_09385, partial [Thermoanaerobaculia bacterium]